MRFVIFAVFLCSLWFIQYAYGDENSSYKDTTTSPPGLPGHWKEEQSSDSDSNSEISRLKVLVENQQKKIALLESKVDLLETELQKQKQKSKTK